jgi:hypothetical protein
MSKSGERPISRFEVSAKSHVEVALGTREETLFIHLRQADGKRAARLSIPAAMLPELKRAVARVEEALSEWGQSEDFEDAQDFRGKAISFANDSEREFAALLDFYRIRWEYEPTTFPIVWDSRGNVAESFTPDFFLADLNIYIELTTMKQSLVTRKNRKVRLFQQHYPHLPIRIFYGRDYRALLRKYGLAPEPAEATG